MYYSDNNSLVIEKHYNDRNEWHIKYPGLTEVHASINETKREGRMKFQVIVRYGTLWLREMNFATYDESVKWLESSMRHFLDVDKQIHDRVWALEYTLVERYKNFGTLEKFC